MQHSTVRSIIIWSNKDHFPSGLIEVTNPTLLKKKPIIELKTMPIHILNWIPYYFILEILNKNYILESYASIF